MLIRYFGYFLITYGLLQLTLVVLLVNYLEVEWSYLRLGILGIGQVLVGMFIVEPARYLKKVR